MRPSLSASTGNASEYRDAARSSCAWLNMSSRFSGSARASNSAAGHASMQGCWCDGRSTRCVPLPFASPRAFERGPKWRGNGDAALGIQPVVVGAEEVGHPARIAFPVGRGIRHSSQSPAGAWKGVQSKRAVLPITWFRSRPSDEPDRSSLGWHGITWEIMGSQRDLPVPAPLRIVFSSFHQKPRPGLRVRSRQF